MGAANSAKRWVRLAAGGGLPVAFWLVSLPLPAAGEAVDAALAGAWYRPVTRFRPVDPLPDRPTIPRGTDVRADERPRFRPLRRRLGPDDQRMLVGVGIDPGCCPWSAPGGEGAFPFGHVVPPVSPYWPAPYGTVAPWAVPFPLWPAPIPLSPPVVPPWLYLRP